MVQSRRSGPTTGIGRFRVATGRWPVGVSSWGASGPGGPWKTVIGVESATGPEVLDAGCCFSLDLRDGVPLRPWADGPEGIATLAVERGVGSLIVLDLARVGTGTGTGTEELCGRLRSR